MPLILSIGNLIERKGHKYLILACNQLSLTMDDISLVIVGEGPERDDLLRTWEVFTNQRFSMNILPRQTNRSIRDLYEQADVFVLPSVTDSLGLKEGLGLVLIEAIHHELPCVAFPNGGVVDIIYHKYTGYLAEERNIEDLAYWIEEALRGELDTKRAKKIIDEKFNLGRITRKVDTELMKLVLRI